MAITRTLRAVSGAALAGALVFASSPTAAADEVRDKQWPLESYNAEAAWKVTKGAGQIVAVIDDGVDANHVDLRGSVLKGKDFIDGGSAEPKPGDIHGTAMSSLIAGRGHGPDGSEGVKGLAPEAKILPIRDHGAKSNSGADSIRYAVDQGASVINISQGGGSFSSTEKEAISHALERDVLVVAPTGNSGESDVEYPAAYPGVLAISGVTKSGNSWSGTNYGSETILSGPAAGVIHAGGHSDPKGYAFQDGTSAATAYASAAAALVRAEFPDLTAGQVATRLTETAGLPESENALKLPDKKYGYGSIQPLKALTGEVPKGSKYGPLSVPDSIGKGTSEEQINAGQEQADQKALILQVTAGVVVLVLVAVIVLVVVLVRRKKRNGPGGPGGWGPPGGQAGGGYGQPPHQQQPGQYAPPQQPPRS